MRITSGSVNGELVLDLKTTREFHNNPDRRYPTLPADLLTRAGLGTWERKHLIAFRSQVVPQFNAMTTICTMATRRLSLHYREVFCGRRPGVSNVKFFRIRDGGLWDEKGLVSQKDRCASEDWKGLDSALFGARGKGGKRDVYCIPPLGWFGQMSRERRGAGAGLCSGYVFLIGYIFSLEIRMERLEDNGNNTQGRVGPLSAFVFSFSLFFCQLVIERPPCSKGHIMCVNAGGSAFRVGGPGWWCCTASTIPKVLAKRQLDVLDVKRVNFESVFRGSSRGQYAGHPCWVGASCSLRRFRP